MRLFALAVGLWMVNAADGNMNGKYSIASGAKQDVPFNDDYASKGHEYFDLWSPELATQYAQVYWADMNVLQLPPAIVKRFAGKVMAITGYEFDQVMVNPVGQPGVNPTKDVSVPITWAYNHHYSVTLTGNYSELVRVQPSLTGTMDHGAPKRWRGVDKPSAKYRADPSLPTSQWLSEGNGGESRKSFHGYPSGYAQLIESPEVWHITPMQIDTRNRDCGVTPDNVTDCPQFTPGPEPKQARYGFGIPKEGTNYSGLIECPCTSRYGGDGSFYPGTLTKQADSEYASQAATSCLQGVVPTAADCFTAVNTIGLHATIVDNKTTNDPKLPVGCSFQINPDNSATAFFNAAVGTTAPCAVPWQRSGQATSAINVTLAVSVDFSPQAGPITFDRMAAGLYCSLKDNDVINSFKAAGMTPADDLAVLAKCETFCKTHNECQFCAVTCVDETGPCTWNAIPLCGGFNTWSGRIAGDISSKQSGNVTITMTGPSDVWFGVGLDSTEMRDEPWAIIVQPSGILEQKLGTCGDEGNHCPGDLLNASLTTVSNTVVSGVRTVVFTRQLKGLTDKHYTFTTTVSTISFITAIGSTPNFSYHKMHSPATITLASTDVMMCVCDLGGMGAICDSAGQNCNKFIKSCLPPPDGSLQEQHNPTCLARTYAGGLNCCAHKRILLDVDQVSPPDLLRYHMKFRIWFQEYVPSVPGTNKPSHQDLPRIYQQTEANAGEYDIPPAFPRAGMPVPGYPDWPLDKPTPGTTCTGTCPDGPDCSCYHEIHFRWVQSPSQSMRLIYAGGHCHAPSCLSMELYRNDTGELLCQNIPKIGLARQGDKWDEAGYIALPPCLWGNDTGLEPSVLLPPGTPLLAIKRNHNTNGGHYGEMASWQMRGVFGV